ncbi:SPOR domain-containing protein [uncultured Desulfovibrio sp.]|uniref:SPOR domain-containing protein n=1 Tax=uncultured Desulfovibrio sp. TaxID=167968 RepID=UPI003209B4E4
MSNPLRQKKTPGREEGTRPGIPLTLPSMLAVLFLALVAISSAYLVGVMFGRSQWESSSPMSTDSSDAPRNVRPDDGTETAEASAGEDDGASASAPESSDAGREAEGILSAEELRFSRVLRAAPGESVELASPPLPPAVPPQPAPAQPAPGSPQTAAVPPMPPGMQAAVPEGQTAPPPAPATMHDYVFQVGAFRDEASVDDLRQRLEGRGLRTRMERSGKLYLVLVLLRGTDERAAEIPRIMEELRLGKPLLRSRKPVLR